MEPLRIPQPPTVEDARRIAVGARVARFWGDPHNDWFEADVISVDDDLEPDLELPDDIIDLSAFYCLLRYPPQKGYIEEEREDVKWELVFESHDAEVLELPPGGQLAFPLFLPPGDAARSRQPPPQLATPLRAATQQRSPEGFAPGTGASADADVPGGSGSRRRKQKRDASGLGGSSKGRAAGKRQQGGSSKRAAPEEEWGDEEAGVAAPAARRPRREQHTQPQPGVSLSLGLSGSLGGAAEARRGAQQDVQQPPRGARQQQRGAWQGRPPRAVASAPDHSEVPDPPGALGAGQIKRAELRDFMCHDHLVIDLCPHVNLLSGSNGSGKSALLAALMLCLGSRAVATGRFNAFKGFVKEEATQALIKITLWNTGAFAYRRAELGPELSVVRRVNRPSGGTHEIQDWQGRTVFRGTRAVHELMDYLNINCSNPAIVLTQDMAKLFAGSTSEKDKYRGYMQATEFDKTVEHMKQSSANIHEMQRCLADLERMLEEAEQKEAALEAKRGAVEEMEAWQRNHSDLQHCMAWLPMDSAEHDMQRVQAALDGDVPAEQASLGARVANLTAQVAAIEAQIDQHEQTVAQAEAAAQGHEAQLHGLREQHKAKGREVAGLRREAQHAQREVAELEGQRDALRDASRDVEREYLESTQQQVDQYKQRVSGCRDQSERATVAASNAREQLAERQAAVQQAQEEAHAARQAVERGRRRREELEKELRGLEAAQTAPLAKFGGRAAVELHRLVQEAQAQGRFSQPPIHIGSSLALSDQRWAVAAEAAVGRLLAGWVVNSTADAQIIQALRRQAAGHQQWNPPVIAMSYAHPPHRIPPASLPPEGRCTTVLSVLRFAEAPHAHVLRNVLIDHGSVERTLLTSTHQEAMAIVRDAAFWRQYRLNRVYAADGSYAYRRGFNETSLPPPRDLRPRLVPDMQQQLADCRREFAEAQAAVAQLEGEAQQKADAVQQARRELAAAEQQHQAALQHRSTMRSQYQDALSQQPLGGDGGGDAGASDAAQALGQLTQRLLEAEASAGAAEEQLEAAEREHAELAVRYQAARQAPQHVSDELDAANRAIQELAGQKVELRRQLDAAQAQQAQLDAKVAQARRALAGLQRDLADARADAEQICSRAEAAAARQRVIDAWRAAGKSEEAIAGLLDDKRLQQYAATLERKISQRSAEAGVTLEELGTQLELAMRRKHKLAALCEGAGALLDVCEPAYKLRTRKFKELRTGVATNLSLAFGRYLHYRGHRGKVEVDHKEGRLSMAVGITGQEPTTHMASLSGGERSMASLAFILALGHAGVQPPFHALDEFDVFMDGVNRRYALEFLLEFAVHNQDRQLLLFTPQDIAVVEEAKEHVASRYGGQLPNSFIKVQRLRSPRERHAAQQAQQQAQQA